MLSFESDPVLAISRKRPAANIIQQNRLSASQGKIGAFFAGMGDNWAMRFLVVDATGYLFRAFHAAGDFRAADGTPTGAMFVLINMLRKLRQQWPAEREACVMDAPGKTFRHQLSPDYKANRPPLNPDLRAQIAPAKEFIAAMGWPLICHEGVEADDVIATLAEQGARDGMEVVIASGDKDLMQFVGGAVRVFDGMRDKLYDENAVREKFGVAPKQISDFLALCGDTSDNIRGVKKVGAKTAAKWLNEHGDLDGVIRAADSIGGVVGNNLREAVADGVLELSRQLTAVKTDVALPQNPESLSRRSPDLESWRALCEKYQFRQLASALESENDSANEDSNTRAKIVVIDDLARLRKVVAAARASGMVALDVETVGEPVMRATLAGFSLAHDSKSAAYVPLAHEDVGGKQIPMEKALAELRPLLEDEKVVKIFHNGKYDLHIFANYGLHIAGTIEDTKIAAALLSPGRPHTLSALAERHLGIQAVAYRDVVDGKTVKHFGQADIATAADYAAEDAEVTFQLHKLVVGGLNKTARKIYEEIDRPLMPLLHSMERTGARIDGDALRSLSEEWRRQMAELESEAHETAGESFNLNAPRQVERLLFDKMGAPPLRKTAKGAARSTDERTLEALAPDYPLAKTLLAHRTLAKLTGTYADKLPKMIHPRTGRVHTDFNQTSVHTGRLASSAPNLQNIPIRTADGRRIRQAFVADEGCAIVSADYSQIELRLMAHIANDESLLDAFKSGADIHRRTAAEVFETKESEVDAGARRAAKAINFGLIYGMSAFGLGRTLGISPKEAQAYMERYFGRYPRVAAYMKNIRERAESGYVETIVGRQIPVLAAGAQAAMRAAINAPMQGSAADIIKIAMLKVEAWLRKNKMQTRMILQVHDELVFESPLDEEAELRAGLPPLMASAAKLKIPLEVDVGVGSNWDAAH